MPVGPRPVGLWPSGRVRGRAACRRTGEITGKAIQRTKEAPKPPERAQWVKKELSERTNIIRYSKGPDGTRGFAMGRGRPISAAAGGSTGDAI